MYRPYLSSVPGSDGIDRMGGVGPGCSGCGNEFRLVQAPRFYIRPLMFACDPANSLKTQIKYNILMYAPLGRQSNTNNFLSRMYVEMVISGPLSLALPFPLSSTSQPANNMVLPLVQTPSFLFCHRRINKPRRRDPRSTVQKTNSARFYPCY